MIENEKIEEMMFDLEERAEKSLTALENEYSGIRAGRANPKILDRIEVEAYGGMSKLIELGNVAALDARCLQINLWDKSLLKAVEKAILQSNIGITPTNDGQVIRLVFPELTEERRKDLVKDVKKKGEEAKVAVRNIRRDANDSFKKLAKTEVSEDEIKDLEDSVQKLTDKYVKDIDKAIDEKSKEILTV